jgi:hypothetical protein
VLTTPIDWYYRISIRKLKLCMCAREKGARNAVTFQMVLLVATIDMLGSKRGP